MKFSCHSSDRTSWILEIAQDWMKNQISTDINVVCVDDEKVTNYQCHKLIISSFFEKELSMFLIDETEEIILPEVCWKVFLRQGSLLAAHPICGSEEIISVTKNVLGFTKLPLTIEQKSSPDVSDLKHSH